MSSHQPSLLAVAPVSTTNTSKSSSPPSPSAFPITAPPTAFENTFAEFEAVNSDFPRQRTIMWMRSAENPEVDGSEFLAVAAEGPVAAISFDHRKADHNYSLCLSSAHSAEAQKSHPGILSAVWQKLDNDGVSACQQPSKLRHATAVAKAANASQSSSPGRSCRFVTMTKYDALRLSALGHTTPYPAVICEDNDVCGVSEVVSEGDSILPK